MSVSARISTCYLFAHLFLQRATHIIQIIVKLSCQLFVRQLVFVVYYQKEEDTGVLYWGYFPSAHIAVSHGSKLDTICSL